ncbi:MAG: hypothetical protein KAT71_07980 [Gammaproteobacteria bacterium]|nr:hypothetical protein [Gammaproteobacteria bacterium]
MIFVLFLTLLGRVFYNAVMSRRVINKTFAGGDLLLFFLFCISAVCLMMTFLTVGTVLFSAHKLKIMSLLSHWWVVWENAIIIGGVLAFVEKKWKYFCCFLAFVAFDVYVGFRFSAAMLFISIVTLWLYSKGRQRLIINSRWELFLVSLGGACFFIYKFLYILVKLGDWQQIWQSLAKLSFFSKVFTQSEPFTTLSILNTVIQRNFHAGFASLAGVLHLFLLFGNDLNLHSVTFNSLFQPVIFPLIKFQMANNIWAEMWSAGGWFLLVLFIIIFVFVIFCFSFLLQLKDKRSLALTVAMGSCWSFYIHRNSFSYQLQLERRILLVWFGCLVVSMLICSALKRPHITHSRYTENR